MVLPDIIFCLNRDNTDIMSVLGNGDPWGVVIRYSIEEHPVGTAGALGALSQVLADEPFLVLGCNTLFDFDLNKLITEHQRSGATATTSRLPTPDFS